MTEKELIDLVDEFCDTLGDDYKVAYCPRNVIVHKPDFDMEWHDAFFFDMETKKVYFTLLTPISAREMCNKFMEEKGLYIPFNKNSEWDMVMLPKMSFR